MLLRCSFILIVYCLFAQGDTCTSSSLFHFHNQLGNQSTLASALDSTNRIIHEQIQTWCWCNIQLSTFHFYTRVTLFWIPYTEELWSCFSVYEANEANKSSIQGLKAVQNWTTDYYVKVIKAVPSCQVNQTGTQLHLRKLVLKLPSRVKVRCCSCHEVLRTFVCVSFGMHFCLTVHETSQTFRSCKAGRSTTSQTVGLVLYQTPQG